MKNIEQDHVRRMLAFKQRQPTVKFDLSPNEFSARLPGVDEPFCSMSLRGLMDRLERWEAGQETSRLGFGLVDIGRMVRILLELGLTITTERCEAIWTVTLTGGRREASGVAESAHDALSRAGWRWLLN